jgi:ribosomal protein S27AE
LRVHRILYGEGVVMDLRVLRAVLDVDLRGGMLMLDQAIEAEDAPTDLNIFCPRCGTRLVDLRWPCSVCAAKAAVARRGGLADAA